MVGRALAALSSIASAAAFDLVAIDGGAVLVYAPAGDASVRSLALDAFGAARAEPRTLAQTDSASTVVELALAAESAQRIGVVWVESARASSRTRVLLADVNPQRPSADAQQLASVVATTAEPAVVGVRGRVGASALGGGRVRVMYETGPSPCVENGTGPCVGFGFRDLEEPPPARQEPWLSVPLPCVAGAASVATLEGRWYYALCSRARAPSFTTAYSINLETAYARADEVLAGCTPLGMTPIDSSTILLGADCPGAGRRAARLTLDAEPASEISLAELELSCDGERATLRARDWGLPLDTPRDRLEAILPAALAPSGSRAVATGSALLVAQPTSTGLQLTRYLCRRGALQHESSGTRQAP